MSKWKCAGCGYIHDGDDAPEKCPKCNAPKEQFTELDSAAASLVERSRHTNALHSKVIDLARQIDRIEDERVQKQIINLIEACSKKG